MFDAKLTATTIKKRYEWQAYRKLNKEEFAKREDDIIKKLNMEYGGHFAKVIKINKIKYILICDLLKAIYQSTMEEEKLGDWLQIKSQDELG